MDFDFKEETKQKSSPWTAINPSTSLKVNQESYLRESIVTHEYTDEMGDKYKSVTRTVIQTNNNGLGDAIAALISFAVTGCALYLVIALMIAITDKINPPKEIDNASQQQSSVWRKNSNHQC